VRGREGEVLLEYCLVVYFILGAVLKNAGCYIKAGREGGRGIVGILSHSLFYLGGSFKKCRVLHILKA
jgi:hypothetical protein